MTPGIEDTYPLTPVQEGMLFHHLRWGGAGIDIEQIVGSVPDDLDVDRFGAAWREVASRHPALRTCFAWQHREKPVQQVWKSVSVPLALANWSGAGGDPLLRQFLQADRLRGFDLSQAPLFRVTIGRREGGRSTFVWTLHHAILDGRAFPEILAEVFEHYEAGPDSDARPQPVRKPLRAYIDSLAERNVAADEAFWHRLLAGFTTPTPLVIGSRSRDGVVAGEPGDAEIALPDELAGRLRTLAATEDVTLNTLVQGAWAVVWSRYADSADVVFGAARACRQGPRWASVIGPLINTVPVRAQIDPDLPVREWLKRLREQWTVMRAHERTPLADIQRCSPLGAAVPLFETLVVFDSDTLEGVLRARGGKWADRSFRLLEKNSYPITLVASAGPPFLLRLEFERERIDDEAACRLLGHLTTVLEAMAGNPAGLVGDLPVLTAAERQRLLDDWNRTAREYVPNDRVDDQIARQSELSPDRIALVYRGSTITYRELERQSRRLAEALKALGAGPGTIVGLCASRSIEMVVGLLGILKSGAAYLPLDPEYPEDRLRFMIGDAQVPILVTDTRAARQIASVQVRRLFLDDPGAWPEAGAGVREAPRTSGDLAYVIYTSGSTGKPKGVMVTHRNVVNFLTAMDGQLGREPGVWLAVSSLSFDISVLELLWTLARGFTVVVHAGAGAPQASSRAAERPDGRRIDFSLFYFASDEGQDVEERYRLLLEGARFADARGFAAVWTPERHFHAFGGLYPNPSVVSAAIAVQTSRIRIRAGSVVLPLHHPARVAEEWAVVDNLSKGRVDISFASGWRADDFLLQPDNYADAKAIMLRHVDVVRRLWRGEAVMFPGPNGHDVPVRTRPRPVQPELPVWITAAGNPATFRMAGEAGASVLTHLLGQTLEELQEKLETYRVAWRRAGHGGTPHVTLMLHTFVGESAERVRAAVRGPMMSYLSSSIDLIKGVASTFPVFKNMGGTTAAEVDALFENLRPDELDALTEHAFERYYQTGGLFGTVDECAATIARLKAIGVDEVACLVDFGLDTEVVLTGLEHLDALRARTSAAGDAGEDHSIAAEIARYGVTHLQCTPSLASLLVADPAVRPALARLRHLLIGGEALSPVLAADLLRVVTGSVTNMYGPTETTVWSACWKLDAAGRAVPIGRPVANTRMYVLDRRRNPVPIGIPGELYIAGDGVTNGYLFRPELTAERFVADGMAAHGERMYRTGDLVRYRPDGALEFLGRLDHQVKIRGHRIELEEIETALRQQPGVGDAVVIVREDRPNDVRLVGYVAVDADAAVDSNGLRNALRTTLPETMVPSAIACLPALPRTPNGKVDRRALPSPHTVAAPEPHRVAPGPKTHLEEQIAAVWREVLGLPVVGVEDNFFDIGGHSLLTVHVMARLRETVGTEIHITDLFRFPTVRSLAQHLGGDVKESPAMERARARASRRLANRQSPA